MKETSIKCNLTKEQLKHIAHLLSQDAHRYKKYKNESEENKEHHKMLTDALDEAKRLAHGN